MRKNFADLVKIGIVIPAVIVSMAACGAATAQGAPADEKAETTETTEATEAAEATDKTESGEPAAEVTAEPRIRSQLKHLTSTTTELSSVHTRRNPSRQLRPRGRVIWVMAGSLPLPREMKRKHIR